MFERELKLYNFNLEYLRRLTADLADADLTHVPAAGAKAPLWILGHLALSTDYASHLLGLKRACPREWHARFGPGSDSSTLDAPHPSKAELLAAIEAGHERVAAAAATASSEALDQPHSIELLKHTPIVTVGDALAHLLCTHAAFHISQLATWNRLRGKPHMF